MTYTITRENPERDLKALRELLDRDRTYLPAEDSFDVLRELRDSIEEQVKPAIEEPTEFGSIVRARCSDTGPLSYLWQQAPPMGRHYWESEKGAVEVWSELTDVEVLRVGIGEPRAHDDGDLYMGGCRKGAEATVSRGIRVLEAYRKGALTAERKHAYETAINVLRELR
jgi:hypothetical protein